MGSSVGENAVFPLAALPEWHVITLRETFERINAYNFADRFEA